MIQRLRAAQIEEINEFLISTVGAKRMAEAELTREGHRFAGWTAELTVGGHSFGVRILLGRGFPYHPPEIFLQDTSYYLKFPHVEKTGKLCLTPGAASFSPARPKETMRFLIDHARKLLAESVDGTNKDDFITEFQSYWPGHLVERATPFWSLIRPGGDSRIVHCWSGSEFTLFAESPAGCRQWLKNFNGGSTPKGMKTVQTAFIWTDQPIYPSKYPATSAAFRHLTQEAQKTVDALLIQIAPQDACSLPVMFGFPTAAGPVLGGLVLQEPKTLDKTGKRSRNCKCDGFRPGKVPSQVLMDRYFSATPAAGANVFRADADWIFARGGNAGNLRFAKKRVGILGCGSLGADIAFLLAKSGVGSLYLTDNQVLSLDNIGRHLLGANSVRQNKSDALARFLTKQLPALNIETSGVHDIETLLNEQPKIFEKLDLIISTVGDWASECALNVASRQWPNFPPVIFAWTEAYGVAGHALLVNDRGGCLSCGMTEHGLFEGRVVDWQDPDKTLTRATGCGDFYQPYGSIDVAPIKTMIAEFALDCLSAKIANPEWRTWIGDVSRLKDLGGSLSAAWKEKSSLGDVGRRLFVQRWDQNSQCPLCN
jgi:molybdopterin/thiamine biosynthesis adenylyltransferase